MTSPQYAVIKFVSDDTYSEIPVAWLIEDGQFCYWPRSSRNIYSMMLKGVLPDPLTWDRYAIKLEGKYQTLQQARRKAEDSDYPTTTTDDEQLGKGKRKKKRTRKTSSPTSSPSTSANQSEDDEEPFELPTPPQQISRTSLYKDPLAKISEPVTINPFEENVIPYEDVTLVNINPTDIGEAESIAAPNTSYNIMSVDCSILEKIHNLCSTIHIQMLSIESRICKLEGTCNFKGSTEDAIFKKCIEYLPLTDVEKMKSFDTRLKEDEVMRRKYMQYISNIGGRHTKDIIHRILKKTFTNELGVHCSWLGQRNNVKVCDLKITNLIKEVVQKTSILKERDFETIGSEWFRLSKLRFTREQKSE